METDHERAGALVFANCNAAFIKNDIILNCNVTDIFGPAIWEARDNTVQVNGNVTESVSAGNPLFINNTVTATGYIQRCLEVMIPAMTADIVFEENHIEASAARPGSSVCTYFLIVSTTMNNYKIQMADNTVTAPEPFSWNIDNCLYDIKDTEIQYINIAQNNVIPPHYLTRRISSDEDLIVITNN